jgi:KDO2-lipid IV(A) lauroyltransferase
MKIDFASRLWYAFLLALGRLIPRRLSYLLGETSAVWFYRLSKTRRCNLRGNLTAVMGTAAPEEVEAAALRVMKGFGRNIVDTLLLPHMKPAELDAAVDVVGSGLIDTAIASGRGAILVTAHLGSWELAGAALAARGYRMTTVAGTQFTPAVSPAVKAMKQQIGISVVSAETGTYRMVKALRKAEAVVLHLDGDQYGGSAGAVFFGKEVGFPRGPAALALKTGAALLPAFAVRISRERMTIFIEEEIATQGEDEASLTVKLASVLEDFIRRYPDQWCMFRRFWGEPQ